MNHSLRGGACTVAVLATLLLTACGGGSDDDGTPVKPVISEETARLRRMALPEGPTTATAAPAAAAAAR